MIEPLRASEGMVYTNGQIYNKLVFLGIGENRQDWYEISIEEAEKIQSTYKEVDINE